MLFLIDEKRRAGPAFEKWSVKAISPSPLLSFLMPQQGLEVKLKVGIDLSTLDLQPQQFSKAAE